MKKQLVILYIASILVLMQKGHLNCAEPITQSNLSLITSSNNEKTLSIPELKNTQKPKNLLAGTTLQNVALNEEESAMNSLKNNTAGNNVYDTLRLFATITDLIQRKCFKKVDFKEFVSEALKAALPYCDPHSAFFDPKSYQQTKDSTSENFSGIGVSVISKDITDDWIIVTDVIQGGPSDKAGLQTGDKIIEINGEKLRGLTSDEVLSKLKGPANTKAKIKIMRNEKPIDKEFIIVREIIKNEVATSYFFKDHNVAYISLKLFSENAASNIAKHLKKAVNSKCKGIILDLGGNPGGILDVAVDMAGLFIDKDSTVVLTKDRDLKTVGEYKTTKAPIYDRNIPLFIIINNFTASASEILCGCLRHYSNLQTKNNEKPLMVFLIGTTTYGKGSVQEVIPLIDGCALKLTIMLYYLPDGSSIQPLGIKPDFFIQPRITPEQELKWQKEFYGTEASLKRHITNDEALGKAASKKEEAEKEKEPSWEEKFKKSLHSSMPIRTAINMINLIDLAKQIAPKSVDNRDKTIKFLKEHCITDEMPLIAKL